MNIGLVSVNEKPIKRRLFMCDQKWNGEERRRTPRPYNNQQFNRILESACVVLVAAIIVAMFVYL